MAPRRLSIVIVDRSTRVFRRFDVRVWPAALGVLGLLTLPILMGLGARWSAQAAIDELRRANAALEIENASYREVTVQLSSQVSALQAAVDEIGGSTAMDPAVVRAMAKLPAVVRSRAMGGGSEMPGLAPALAAPFAPGDAALGVLRDLLTMIESRLETVRYGAERRQALAGATPSIWPVVGWLSSRYGNRRDPFTGFDNFHPGLDISANRGEPVIATADGVVVTAARSGNYGNLVVIDHGFGITTRYGHLSRFSVRSGQQIKRGDVIGYVGSTGRSTSPHLHYEVWVNGRLTNPMRLLGPR